jgi:hypothetical protein
MRVPYAIIADTFPSSTSPADPSRLVREVNKIDGYRSRCGKTKCDPIQLVWMVKEIEG